MNLNPFDLSGPPFLLFYLLLTGVTVGLAWMFRRRKERVEEGQVEKLGREIAQDPYQIAYLRSGPNEALRVALVSLLERGLLVAENNLLSAVSPGAASTVSHPLEKAILSKFQKKTLARLAISDPMIRSEVRVVGNALELRGVLPDAAVRASRRRIASMSIAVLLLVAGIKIVVALGRGHSNIIFLVIIAGAASLLLNHVVVGEKRTMLGSRILGWITQMLSGLLSRRERLQLRQTTNELTYLAAVFGFYALPAGFSETIQHLNIPMEPFEKRSGSGCGSSCGTSSCGGGGCGGGGCGGCGGCG